MPDNTTSLIEHGSEQLELISSADMDAALFAESESRGEHTGARLWRDNPDKYRVIVSLLAEGVGQLRIASLTKSSVHTVRALAQREGAAIDKERERIAADGRSAAKLCVEEIIERLADADKRASIVDHTLGIWHGILVDKSELLAGRATSRVEVCVDPDLADFREMVRRAKSQTDGFQPDNSEVIEAEVSECRRPGDDAGVDDAGDDVGGDDVNDL